MKRTYRGQVFNVGDWVRINTMAGAPLAQVKRVLKGGAFLDVLTTTTTEPTRAHASCLTHVKSPLTQ